MKKLIFLAFAGFAFSASAQVKNGIIYKEHPYITIVNQVTAAVLKGDSVGYAKFYADTAKFYDSPDPKTYNLKKAVSNIHHIFTDWEQISITPRGYPDALQYDHDPFTVQSWWVVTAVNKKTKKTATFEEVVFDMFNKDGKIVFEGSYYDTSSLMAAMK